MTMCLRLKNLHPELDGMVLSLECPTHRRGDPRSHRIELDLREFVVWGRWIDGFTIMQAIRTPCWIGRIEDGAVISADDQPATSGTAPVAVDLTAQRSDTSGRS